MPADDDGEVEVRNNAALVNRLVEFTFKLLNTELEPFFNEHCMVFDQEGEDLQQRGETLEQYAAFKKYEKELEGHLDKFVKNEGFDSVAECFQTINGAVKKDLAEQEKRMKELMEHIRKTQAQWMKSRAEASRAIKAEAKGGGDGGDTGGSKGAAKAGGVEDDAPAGAKAEAKGGGGTSSSTGAKAAAKGAGAGAGAEAEGEGGGGGDDEADTEAADQAFADLAPMMMFYQPITLEQLVQTVLSVGEYQTFSMMMRMKVRQMQMMRRLRRERKEELRKKRQRLARLRAYDDAQAAGDGGGELEDLLETLWSELGGRIQDLTPHRQDLRTAVEGELQLAKLRAWLAGEAAPAPAESKGEGGGGTGDGGAGEQTAQEQQAAWLRFVFGRLAALCSWSHASEIMERQAALDKSLRGEGGLQPDAPPPPLPQLLLTILRDAHAHIDRIKGDIFASLNAHYGHISGGGDADDDDDDEEEVGEGGDSGAARAEAKGGGQSSGAGAKAGGTAGAKAGGQAK
eukprot:g7337.t1